MLMKSRGIRLQSTVVVDGVIDKTWGMYNFAMGK